MKLIVSVILTLVFGVGAGWILGAIEQSRSGEHFSPYNALNPSLAVPTQQVSENPEIQITNGESYNFGNMMLGDTKSWVFVVKNSGKQPLELRLGETTCKCTFISEGAFDKDGKTPTVVKPGETLDVELQWSPKDYEMDFFQSAELKTNDPAREVVTLQVRGKVSKTAQITPELISLPNVNSSDGTTTVAAFLCAMEEGEWNILDIQWSNPDLAEFFTVELGEIAPDELESDTEAVDPKSGRKLTITAKPGIPLGPISQTLILKTDIRDGLDVACEIFGNVISDITIIGRGFKPARQRLIIPPVDGKAGGKTTLQILVKGENHKNIEFEMVKVLPEGVMKVYFAEGNSTENHTRVPLIVEFPAGTAPVSGRGQLNKYGEIHFKTNHPVVKEVKLYVSFVVK